MTFVRATQFENDFVIVYSYFSGASTVLQSNFLPEIMLDERYDYSCALLDLIIKNKKNSNNTADDLKKIIRLGVIQIKCDIVSGSYINVVQDHTIHQFASSASIVKGQEFVEIPKHLNYLPIKSKNLRSIRISIRKTDRFIQFRRYLSNTDQRRSHLNQQKTTLSTC